MKRNWAVICATLGPMGYLTAPGTVATIVTIPLVYWLRMYVTSQITYAVIILGTIGIAALIIKNALVAMRAADEDPTEIILDEVVGCMLVFWGVTMGVQQIMVGLILFRILDILKIGWIARAEKLSGAWGVLADDLLAALITNGVLRLLL